MRWRTLTLFILAIFLSLNFVSAEWTSELDTNLTIYYDFNQSEGSTIERVSGELNLSNAGATYLIGRVNNGTNNGGIGINNLNHTDHDSFEPGLHNFAISFWILRQNLTGTGDAATQPTPLYKNGSDAWKIMFDRTKGGSITFQGFNYTGDLVTTASYADGNWHHILINRYGLGSNQMDIYIDNVLILTATNASKDFNTTGSFYLMTNADGSSNAHNNITMDEFGLWRRNLSTSEIGNLYNEGNGVTYTPGNQRVDVTLNSPGNNSFSISDSIIFNGTLTPTVSNLTNATLHIWFLNSTLYFSKMLNITGIVANDSVFNVSSIDQYVYHWNIFGCVNETNFCSFAPTNFTVTFGLTNITTEQESQAYISETQNFNVTFNVSSGTPTATLYYNGTGFAGTGTNIGGSRWRFTKDLTLISSYVGTQNPFWNINIGNVNYNTSSQTHTVNNTNLTFCGAAPQDVRFINFTFKDEDDNSDMQAKIDASTWTYWIDDSSNSSSYTFSNTTASNSNYAFCYSPPDGTVTVDLTFKYSNTSYPQRTFSLNDQQLTNTTTQQTLYLLNTDDGIYSSVQVVETSNSPIQEVFVTLERQINGVWTVIEAGNTDSAGLVTFWVNPNFDHRLTFEKTGYLTTQTVIRPSQTIYTQILTKSAGDATYNGTLKNMIWVKSPNSGRLDPNTTYTFEFNLTASDNNLDGSFCKFELLNSTGSILNSTTGGNSGGCNVSFTYYPSNNQKLNGKYYIDTTTTSGFVVIDSDAYWIVLETNATAWTTVKSFFEDLKDLPEFGDGLRKEYSRVVFFFIMLAIIVGLFTYFTGYDFTNPGSAILIIFPIIVLASLAGFFEYGHLTQYNFIQKHAIAILIGLLMGGYLFNYMNKQS